MRLRDDLRAEIERLWIPITANSPRHNQLVWMRCGGASLLGCYIGWVDEVHCARAWVDQQNRPLSQPPTHWQPHRVPVTYRAQFALW